jgi:hypothetical protein
VGTGCEHVLELSTELEPHEETGTGATNERVFFIVVNRTTYLMVCNRVVDQYKLAMVNTTVEYR